jgi:NitT/TauT family transport system substrate-binding protein
MQKKLIHWAVHFMLVLGLSGAMELALAKDVVRVAGLTWPGYGWWFIANEKKLAPEVEFTYQPIEDPFESFGLMATGKLDIISSTNEFTPIGVSRNMPVRFVAYGDVSNGTDSIVLRPEFKKAGDLKGKKVAVLEGGLQQLMMGIWLEKNGAKIDSVQYVNIIMDDAAAAFIGGDVAGAQLWEPFTSQVKKSIPKAITVANTREAYWTKSAMIGDGHYMNADFIKNKRPLALKSLRAMFDAIAWWQKNAAAGNEIIAKGLKMKVEDVELTIGKSGKRDDGGVFIYTFMESARFCGVAPGLPPFGQKNGQMKEHFVKTNEWWMKYGKVKEMYPPEKGLDCSLLKELYDSGYRG